MVLFQRFALRPQEREDVVQDTVARLWQEVSRPGFRLRRGLKPLVRRIAASRAIDCLRKRRPTAEIDESLVDPRPNPYELTLRRDEHARLRWGLQSLEPACREIIRLHLEQELPYAEIALRLQRSEATMRVRMFHCVKALRRLMARWA
jgi:RNA polymerase sigma factor (sigma-70 family)